MGDFRGGARGEEVGFRGRGRREKAGLGVPGVVRQAWRSRGRGRSCGGGRVSPPPRSGAPGSLGPDVMPLALLQYNQPFEDAPVVHMSTLTYETPQGTESPPPSSQYLQLAV